MSNVLEYRIGGKTVADIVLQPIEQKGVSLNVVDVGARSGLFFLPPSYAKRAQLIGFEPNREEYRKLVEERTDAMLQGQRMPAFHKKTYHNCAVWDVDGMAPFYLTDAVGSASMLRETSGPIPSKIFMDLPPGSPNHGKPLSVLLGTVQEEIPTECRRIDDVINAEDIVDLLKIDVEGGELHVLRGADKLLSEHRALFIYSEFVLASVRENDSNLWQQHKYLHERGYRLIDLDMNHHRYSREPMKLPKANDRGMVIAGDAVFVLDPDVNALGREESQRMAAIAFAFGFSSFAMSLLRDAGLTSEADIAAIEQALQHVRLKKRLKDAWRAVPGKVDNFLRGIYRAIGR